MMEQMIDLLKSYDDYFAGNGIDEGRIVAAEEALGIPFSKEYREYLSKCGVASADGHEFTGIIESKRLNVVDASLSAREKHKNTNNLYVVENLQTDGILIWQSSDGKVYRTVYGGEPEYIVDSLYLYLKNSNEE